MLNPLQSIQATPLAPAEMTDAERLHALFVTHGHCQTFRRNTHIYSPGDAPGQLFMVGQGEVRLSRYSNDGRELTLDVRHGAKFSGKTAFCVIPRGAVRPPPGMTW